MSAQLVSKVVGSVLRLETDVRDQYFSDEGKQQTSTPPPPASPPLLIRKPTDVTLCCIRKVIGDEPGRV